MLYTLGEAAKATGKTKAAISQAIAAHRLSAEKDDLGRWQIDPAELHRVYPVVNESAPLLTPARTAEVAQLTATVEGLERLCRQLESERDSLREQNLRLTALLPPPTPPPARRWWQKNRRT